MSVDEPGRYDAQEPIGFWLATACNYQALGLYASAACISKVLLG